MQCQMSHSSSGASFALPLRSTFLILNAAGIQKAKQRKFYEEAECNGRMYQVGCSAYVVINGVAGQEACELEVCEVCEKTSKKRGRKEVPMLECDMCLRGYHLDCLDPPLGAVPEVSNNCHSRCLCTSAGHKREAPKWKQPHPCNGFVDELPSTYMISDLYMLCKW